MTRLCSGHTKAARNGKSRFILIANQKTKIVKIKWGLKQRHLTENLCV